MAGESRALGDGRHGVLLTRTCDVGESVVIRQLLDTYDIPCLFVSQFSPTAMPIRGEGPGEIRIFVLRRHLKWGRKLLAEHLRQGLEVLPGGRDEDEPGVA